MSKILRPNKNIVSFSSKAATGERTTFNTSNVTDDLSANINSDYKRGFKVYGPDEVLEMKDMNAFAFTLSDLTSYLFQSGIAEYDSQQEYHLNQMCSEDGVIYVSLQNDNIGNNPVGENSLWLSNSNTENKAPSASTASINDNQFVQFDLSNNKLFLVDASDDSISYVNSEGSEVDGFISSDFLSYQYTTSVDNVAMGFSGFVIAGETTVDVGDNQFFSVICDTNINGEKKLVLFNSLGFPDPVSIPASSNIQDAEIEGYSNAFPTCAVKDPSSDTIFVTYGWTFGAPVSEQNAFIIAYSFDRNSGLFTKVGNRFDITASGANDGNGQPMYSGFVPKLNGDAQIVDVYGNLISFNGIDFSYEGIIDSSAIDSSQSFSVTFPFSACDFIRDDIIALRGVGLQSSDRTGLIIASYDEALNTVSILSETDFANIGDGSGDTEVTLKIQRVGDSQVYVYGLNHKYVLKFDSEFEVTAISGNVDDLLPSDGSSNIKQGSVLVLPNKNILAVPESGTVFYTATSDSTFAQSVCSSKGVRVFATNGSNILAYDIDRENGTFTKVGNSLELSSPDNSVSLCSIVSDNLPSNGTLDYILVYTDTNGEINCYSFNGLNFEFYKQVYTSNITGFKSQVSNISRNGDIVLFNDRGRQEFVSHSVNTDGDFVIVNNVSSNSIHTPNPNIIGGVDGNVVATSQDGTLLYNYDFTSADPELTSIQELMQPAVDVVALTEENRIVSTGFNNRLTSYNLSFIPKDTAFWRRLDGGQNLSFDGSDIGINSTNINDAIKALLTDVRYPVGAIHMSAEDSRNPAEILGFGTWQKIEGKFIVGHDGSDSDFDDVNASGGDKSHTHSVTSGTSAVKVSTTVSRSDWGAEQTDGVLSSGSIPSVSGRLVTGSGNSENAENLESLGHAFNNKELESDFHNHAINTNTNEASNLPPYLALYLWERIG